MTAAPETMPSIIRIVRYGAVTGLTLTLTACSVLDLVNAVTPDSGSAVEVGIAYGDNARQQLDIYRPLLPSEHASVFVFFYGGAWQRGSRRGYEFVARTLAGQGHYVVVPDYRVYPEVQFPEFVLDGARATAYVFEHLEELANGDRPVYLMGHSAGAHIAMLVAVDSSYLSRFGHETAQIAGVIGLAGPYDFLPLKSRRLKHVFPTVESRNRSQPVNFADAADPPALLIHGDADRTVWPRNSINMASRLRSSGVDVTLRIYPGLSHVDVMKPFVSFIDDDIGLLEDIQSFITTTRPTRLPRVDIDTRARTGVDYREI